MHIETERKFLIVMPEREELCKTGCRVLDIVQTYIMINPATGEEARVRSITENGETVYIHTEKKRISAVSRTEDEKEITKEEYDRLRNTKGATELTKTRYAFPWGEHTVEIDVYPHEIGGDALDGMAVLEVELGAEDEIFEIPPFIKVVRELTGRREFSNKALAKPRENYNNNLKK